MLYSAHQAIPSSSGARAATYGGKLFDESGANAWDLTDGQKSSLKKTT
ncbi:MAG: hypothetical protein LIP01_15145 [Tannerellaceae bacterium]|nr:hypothetical protein [Tannerellaceae bacterium]